MSFASTTDLQNYLGLSSINTTRAQLILDIATAEIQSVTRQTISQVTNDAVKLKGNWRNKIVLPEQPVTAVTSVSVLGLTYVPGSDYSFDGIRSIYRGAVRFTPDSGDPTFVDTELHWGGPDLTIDVVYTHGFATIPADIKGICLAMAARAFRNPVGAQSESVGQYSISYGDVTMTRAEQRILIDWRRRWMESFS